MRAATVENAHLDERAVQLEGAQRTQQRIFSVMVVTQVGTMIALGLVVMFGVLALQSFGDTQDAIKAQAGEIQRQTQAIQRQNDFANSVVCLIEQQNTLQLQEFRAFARRFGVKIGPLPAEPTLVTCETAPP